MVEEFDGPAVGVGRLGEGEEPEGHLGGQDRIAVGLVPAASADCLEEVIGERGGLAGGVVAVDRLDRFAHGQVEAHAAGVAEPVPQSGTDKGVGKAVPVAARLDDEAGSVRRLQSLQSIPPSNDEVFRYLLIPIEYWPVPRRYTVESTLSRAVPSWY